jgi:hypothetical protein
VLRFRRRIDIPVVTVIWSYSGLPAKEMEQRVTLNGLHGSEPLVSSPSDLLDEGEHVDVR